MQLLTITRHFTASFGMIDIYAEHVFPLKDSPKHIPGRPHISTVVRWAQRGCRGIRLETALIGGIRYTSREAVQRFSERTTATANDKSPSRSADHRHVQIEDAERKLECDGI